MPPINMTNGDIHLWILNVSLQCSQVADLTARLQKEKDELTAANETVMQRAEKLSAENGDLSVNNAKLKVQGAKQVAVVNFCHILSHSLSDLTTFTWLAVKFLMTVIRLNCKWSEHEWEFFSEFVLVLCYAPVLIHRCAKAVLCYYFWLKSMLMFVWSQTYVAELEQQLADCESALVEEKVAAQERKHQTEQHQYQVDICSLILLFTFFIWFIFGNPTWKRKMWVSCADGMAY